MKLQAGIFIKSTAALDDTLFSGATILITECNGDGAVGFVVNKPFGRSLNQLEEFRHCSPFPLYNGGPVDQEHLFFLHRRPDVIEEGVAVGNGIYFGGNFKQAVAAISKEDIDPGGIKIFVGYCGWDAGELEAELEEGSWEVFEASNRAVFD